MQEVSFCKSLISLSFVILLKATLAVGTEKQTFLPSILFKPYILNYCQK